MRLKIGLLLSAVVILSRYDWNGSSSLIVVQVLPPAPATSATIASASNSSITVASDGCGSNCSDTNTNTNRLPPAIDVVEKNVEQPKPKRRGRRQPQRQQQQKLSEKVVKTEEEEEANQQQHEQREHPPQQPLSSYPKPMSQAWFLDSLTAEQRNSYNNNNLSQEEKDALWEQKRIQFQYSSKNIVVDSQQEDGHIPRLLHFIYISPGLPVDQPDIPPHIIKTVDKWQEFHPYYQVVLWRNEDIIANFPEILPTLRSLPIMAWIADILRYHIMEKHGGIYLDTDINPLQSIEPLRNRFAPFFVNCQWNRKMRTIEYYIRSSKQYATSRCSMNNSVIGSKAHNPVFKAAMTKVMTNAHSKMATYDGTQTLDVPALSGPKMWNRIAIRYQPHLLWFSLFEPCGFTRDKKNCPFEEAMKNPRLAQHIYATHEFKTSWAKPLLEDPNIIPYNQSNANAANLAADDKKRN